MNGLSFEIVHQAMSYWHGALSEPVLMIDAEEAALAIAGGAILWDLHARKTKGSGQTEAGMPIAGVDWLLADACGGNLIPARIIADTLAQAGIEPGRAVVVYAERRAVDAFVALRALRSIGIADARVCLGAAGDVPFLDTPATSARGVHRRSHAPYQQVDLTAVF